MKILVVVEHFPALSETFVLDQVKKLISRGHDVTVYAVGRPSGSVQHEDFAKLNLLSLTRYSRPIPRSKQTRILGALSIGYRLFSLYGLSSIFAFNFMRHGRSALNLKVLYSCANLIDEMTDFDVIHCHFGDKGVLAQTWLDIGLLTGRLSVVFHAHELCNLDVRSGAKKYSCLFRSNALLLPVSRRWKNLLESWGADETRVRVHHMGVSLLSFPFRQRERSKGDAVRILTVGRLTEQKGFSYSIEAVHGLMAETSIPVRYDIIGEGDLLEELKARIRDYGREGTIRLLGGMTREQVKAELYASDIFLLPSVKGKNGLQEGIPVALMEAMATGLPVVSTRHSGIPELIEHELSGLLAAEKDAADLLGKIRRLLNDPDLAREFAQKGREKVQREFSTESLIADLEATFLEEESLKNLGISR